MNSEEITALADILLFRQVNTYDSASFLIATQLVRGQTPAGYEWVNDLTPPEQRRFTAGLAGCLMDFVSGVDVANCRNLIEQWKVKVFVINGN